jgi:CheY-like chemotaxis protein
MCGAEVRTASTASSAIRAVNEFAPDVLISDIGMPDVDGYELVQEIHKHVHTLPAIALTAFARSEDQSRSLHAGFAAHINKPVEPAELVATVAKVAGKI